MASHDHGQSISCTKSLSDIPSKQYGRGISRTFMNSKHWTRLFIGALFQVVLVSKVFFLTTTKTIEKLTVFAVNRYFFGAFCILCFLLKILLLLCCPSVFLTKKMVHGIGIRQCHVVSRPQWDRTTGCYAPSVTWSIPTRSQIGDVAPRVNHSGPNDHLPHHHEHKGFDHPPNRPRVTDRKHSWKLGIS